MNRGKTSQQREREIETLRRAVEDIYLETDIAPPSSRWPIAPLGPLLERLPLRCVEAAPLHLQTIREGLLRRRAVTPEQASTYLCTTEIEDAALLAGFLFAQGGLGFIFACATDKVVRRRFSVAHELGHFLLHYRPALARAVERGETEQPLRDVFAPTDADKAEDEQTTDTEVNEKTEVEHLARMEREANLFAAEILMPADLVRELAETWRGRLRNSPLTDRLASDLLVSREAMRIRLKSLNIQGGGGEPWD